MKSFAIFLLGIAAMGFADAPDIEWLREWNAQPKKSIFTTQTTYDGGCVFAGEQRVETGTGYKLFPWLAKSNSSGAIVWEKAYTETDYLWGFNVRHFIELSDHGFIAIGSKSLNTGDMIVLIRLNENGDSLWTKKFLASSYITTAIVSNDNGLYLLNRHHIIRLNSSYDKVWAKPFNFFQNYNRENIGGLYQRTNGDLILFGARSINPIDTKNDLFIIKTDENLNVQEKQVILMDSAGFNPPLYLEELQNGNFNAFHSHWESGLWGLTISPDGNILRLKKHAINISHSGINKLAHGGYTTWKDRIVYKINNALDLEWSKELPSSQISSVTHVSSTPQGSIFVGGKKQLFPPVRCKLEADRSPTIVITGPANGAQFASGAAITINVDISNANVTNVTYYSGSTSIGSTTNAPYSFVWNNAADGEHTLSAVATLSGNTSITSPVVSISVGNQTSIVNNSVKAKQPVFITGNTLSISSEKPHYLQIFTLKGTRAAVLKGRGVARYDLKAMGLPSKPYVITAQIGQQNFVVKRIMGNVSP